MIKTKHLVEFMGDINYRGLSPDITDLHKEYIDEIVVRLEEHEELRETIHSIKLCISTIHDGVLEA